jgi:hypothetical protein
VSAIRDFRYVPYIAAEAAFEWVNEPRSSAAGEPRS